MEKLLRDIKRYHLEELKTNNEYAFNVKEADGMYYNIVPSFELHYMLYNETSLEQITKIIHSIVGLLNGSDYKLNKLANKNEILNIDLKYTLFNINGRIKTEHINIILCVCPEDDIEFKQTLHARVYKLYEEFKLLSGISMDMFETPEKLGHQLNRICR